MTAGARGLALLIATKQIEAGTYPAGDDSAEPPTFDAAAWAAWAKAALTQASAVMATSTEAVTSGESTETGASVTAPTPARTTTDRLGRLPIGARL